jgi:hypothetical protein
MAKAGYHFADAVCDIIVFFANFGTNLSCSIAGEQALSPHVFRTTPAVLLTEVEHL